MTERVIVVGVCTFRRPSLRRTLLSIAAQVKPGDASMRIAVADNDETPSAESLVAEVAHEVGQRIVYLHCPARNISLARNGVLQAAKESGADLLAFIDDDEWVEPNWLRQLVEAMDESGATAVFGPVRGVYGEAAPRWMRMGSFHHMTPEVDAGGQVRTGHTSNVLFSLRHPAFADRRFDLAFGRSGGEDTEFFAMAKANGAHLAPAPLAIAYEDVPKERAQLGWLVKRRFRMGQTHGNVIGRSAGPVRRISLAFVASAKVVACAVLTIFALTSVERRNRALLRLCLHAGAVSTLLGMRHITLYGRDQDLSNASRLRLSYDRSTD